MIHSDIAVFLTDYGYFEEARSELEKALLYNKDLSGVHNNWGYYYYKQMKYKRAIESFRKAIELNPKNYSYHNHLAFTLLELGKIRESLLAFRKSLAINGNQPEIRKCMKEHLVNN